MMKQKINSDNEIARQCTKSGEELKKYFPILFDRYADSLRAYCMGMTSDSDKSDDIVQSSFIALLNRFRDGKSVENPKAYLIGTAKNLIFNSMRNRKISRDFKESDLIVQEDSELEKEQLLNLINTALELLDDAHRSAFVMKKYSELTYNEIADVYGISVSAAKMRVMRAQEKIRKILQPYLNEIKHL